MTFDFFNDIFNINTGVKLSNGSFTFNYRGINGIGATPPPELIKEWFGYPIQTAYSLAGDLINWKLYGNSVQRLLPEGYTPLAYIESTGEQYIDTGYVLTGDELLEFEAQFTGTVQDSNYDSFFTGCQNVDTNKGGFWIEKYVRADGSWQWYVRYNSLAPVYTLKTTVGLNERNKLSISSNSFKVDDVEILTPVDDGTYQDTSITIFGRKNLEGSMVGGIWKGWSYNIIKNNNVVRSYVSAKRNSDGKVGMYDLCGSICPLTGTPFYTNAGTGSFIAGPEAPTPSAHIDIKSVGDKTANLFDRNDPTTTINAYVGSSSVGASATITASTNDRSFIIKTKPNTKYTIQKLGGSTPYNRFRVSESSDFPQIGQQATKLYENTETTSGLRTTTITTGNSGNYIIVYGLNGSPGTELPTFLDNFVVCEGETATPYVPYGYQIPMVVSGKNLFDISTTIWGENIDASGTESSSQYNSHSDYIECKPNTTYTVSWVSNETASVVTRYHEYDSDKTWLRQITTHSSRSTGEQNITFTTGATAKYIRFTFRGKSRPASDLSTDIQLEQGSTATTYEPYHAPTTKTVYLSNPLRKVGTYADYIDYENQQVVRNVGVKVLDGVTDGLKFTRVAPLSTFYFSAINQSGIIQTMPVHCTHFINKNVVANNVCYAGTNTITFHHSFPTLEDANTWLASEYANNTPVIVVYPLQTPVTEPLTVPALTLSEGTNLITTETQVKPVDGYAKGKVSQL